MVFNTTLGYHQSFKCSSLSACTAPQIKPIVRLRAARVATTIIAPEPFVVLSDDTDPSRNRSFRRLTGNFFKCLKSVFFKSKKLSSPPKPSGEADPYAIATSASSRSRAAALKHLLKLSKPEKPLIAISFFFLVAAALTEVWEILCHEGLALTDYGCLRHINIICNW